ncbi:beta-lactamase family protein [Sphingomonas donggukensis]|uniref:Beta-lactamase family protein n=1 Tax=Sphingomonas donggukensis TaxID=2949093 RepID=A0ABY4TWD3_9SPHN|nr:serine hydrolase domain-containing protein [Sphingomonas donggukensis]URW76724.1 beta-lactamase family protein [Sphingomonas donggukensis]
MAARARAGIDRSNDGEGAMKAMALAVALVMGGPAVAQSTPVETSASVQALEPQIGQFFETWLREQHAPGLVYGIVRDGRLVAVRGLGTQDQQAKRPVTADTRFRIASMSKAFTALAILDLRDQGKLRLDDLAETYVPEMRGWKYATSDAPRIRIRDLLTHTAGFVDDNPWGDRQQVLTEAEFTAMLKAGVPFSRPQQSAMEYSNFGYATLGRIISNVSGKPYQRYITERILTPLGMTSTGYDVLASPPGSRAIGYRWENGAYLREPDMKDGAFGAMGGVETTASDYAKYVAWLLSAWPARDGAERGPLKRSTVREIVQGSNFAELADRRAGLGEGVCKQATAYAMGWRVIQDCDLSYVTHTGGYPGYGSVVILMPEAGVGVFAFSSRTYGAPVPPAYKVARLMKDAGLATRRPVALTPGMTTGYAAARDVWQAGDILAARDRMAMNMLMDRSAANWRAELARLHGQVGACATDTPIEPVTAMAGRFRWRCDKGDLAGSILLAPTPVPSIQELRFVAVPR